MPVCVGSSLDGKKLKDISLPQNCLLVGIKRGTYELIPKGNTKILAGDYLVVLADEDKATEIREILLNMTQR
jgi:Trk K+ transport system NAD-binding subunit